VARVLALFDLDGTITRHDTLLPYLGGFLRQQPGRLLRLPQALPPLGRFALGCAGRGELKAAWIRAVLGASTRAELQDWTARFVPQLVGNGLIADALAAIEAHRRAGDHLVLLSASPDLYVPAIGRALGFDQVLCTGVEWNGEHLSGRLTTPNRRGAEKARCLEALRQQHAALPIVAYGNAAGDLEHLALADRAVLVNGSVHARRSAARLGVPCVTWH
jgi:phosphatidylglycerophosphatase C